MNSAIGISAAAVAAALCCITLRKQVPELTVVLAITGGAVLLGMIFKPFQTVIRFLNDLENQSGLSSAVFLPVLKVTGIAIITKVAGEICRDAQENGLAAILELGGAVLALAATIPLAQAVLNTLSEML